MISKQKHIEVEVNGIKKSFIHNCWGPSTCFKNLPRLGKAFAVPISMLASGDEDNHMENLPNALFMLFENMEEDDVWELFQLATSAVYLDAQNKLDLDNHLDGDLGAVLMVVAEAIKQNYSSLWGKGLRSLLQVMAPMGELAQTK